jgi:hypothetical protein
MKVYLCLFTVLAIGACGTLAVASDIAQIRHENQQAGVIAQQVKATATRALARKQIVEDLLADTLTLPEAAVKFGELEIKDPEIRKSIRLTLAVESDAERLCQQVLLHVRAFLEDRGEEAETILPRLQNEMHKYVSESEHTPGV